jgi:hypothetical protein
MEIIMKHLNKQLTAIASILIFSIGVMLSCNSFADGGKKATQAALDAEIIDRTDAVNTLQNQINNIHIQIDSLQIDSVTYEIGETGPAGGTVFYVTDGGLHGLEAAPVDYDLGGSWIKWGCEGTLLGAFGTTLGEGSLNTAIIVDRCPIPRDIAGSLAGFWYELNGYTDWFLPSNGELALLYRHKSVIGTLVGSSYWSSSEFNDVYAYIIDFTNGTLVIDHKDHVQLYQESQVRPIRAF